MSCCQRSLLAVGAAAVLCLLVYLVVPFGNVGDGVRSVIGSVPLLSTPAPVLGLRPPSALLRQPSAARCNRLPLMGPLANASAIPTEPAAVKDPVTKEWLIFFTYQEVGSDVTEVRHTLCAVYSRPNVVLACISDSRASCNLVCKQAIVEKITCCLQTVTPKH